MVVEHVTGLVVAFSGDGALALVDTESGPPGPASRVSLVDWRWHRTIWVDPGHGTPLGALPGGRTLAVSLGTDSASAPRTVLLLPGGRAVDLDQPARSGTLAA